MSLSMFTTTCSRYVGWVVHVVTREKIASTADVSVNVFSWFTTITFDRWIVNRLSWTIAWERGYVTLRCKWDLSPNAAVSAE